MVFRLLRSEPGNWRQDTESVAGKHHDMSGFAGQRRGGGIRNRLQRIRAASVLGLARVIEIDDPRPGIKRHILENGPEAVRGPEYLRFALRRQLQGLCVAPALEIEQPLAAPSVLVITDERTVRRSRRSVVLPVPERPKNTAESLLLPGSWLAEQCIGITPRSGRK